MDNKKKIAFILRDLGAGGAQRVLDVLSREFIQKGYQVCVLLTDNKEHYAYKYSDKLEIISLPEWDRQHEKSFVFVNSVIEKLQRAAAKLYYIKRPELFSTRNYFKKKSVMVKHYLSYHPVDIICSLLVEENIIAGMAGKDLNIMTVVAERSFPNRPDLKETTKYFRDRIYKSANVCVFQTEEQRDCFSYLNLKNMVVIPNPIMEGLPMPYNGEREKTIVTYCGLREAKNLPLLIKAFAMIHTNFPDYNLKIYGNGELKGTLEQLIVELNLENFVDIFPFVKEIHQEVRKDALFVLSSDFEGMPNALLEAMAIGMPVIATDCLGGGAKAVIVHKENGLIVPRGDEKALADAIAYMLSHPIESAAMGQNASKIREILKSECIAQKWINVFEERNILNGRAEV